MLNKSDYCKKEFMNYDSLNIPSPSAVIFIQAFRIMVRSVELSVGLYLLQAEALYFREASLYTNIRKVRLSEWHMRKLTPLSSTGRYIICTLVSMMGKPYSQDSPWLSITLTRTYYSHSPRNCQGGSYGRVQASSLRNPSGRS